MSKTPTTTAAFRDNRIERILLNEGYHFTLEEVPLEDVVRYDDSQARVGSLDSRFVSRYRDALKNKAIFPPITVYSNGRAGYVCLDGNHRTEASRRANRATIQAYVLKEALTPDEAVYVSGIINASTNGKPITDKSELARLVLAAAKSRPGVADERIGQELGMSRTRVRNIRTSDAATRRLRGLGIEPSDIGVADGDLRDLHTKIADDTVLKEAAELVRDAGLRGEEFRDLIRGVERAATPADKLVVVQKMRTEKQAEIDGLGKIYILPTEITSAVNNIYKMTQTYPEPDRWNPITPAKRAEFFSKVSDTAKFLARVEAALAPIVEQDTKEAALLEAAEAAAEESEDETASVA